TMPLRAQGRGRSSLLAYGSKSSAATPLRAILLHFPRGSRSLSPRDDLEIGLPRFPAFIATRNTSDTVRQRNATPSKMRAQKGKKWVVCTL
ncbi:MAG: hypothetical protein WC076_07375, partial [Terrimicrobiaceae bacterium]